MRRFETRLLQQVLETTLPVGAEITLLGQDGNGHPFTAGTGGGGGGGAVTPLSRVLVVDSGAAVVSGANGAAVAGTTSGGPFPTIAAANALINPPVSATDAETQLQVWLAPGLGGYTETVAMPPGRTYALQAIPQDAQALGVNVTGNVTLDNVAVTNPPSFCFYSLVGVNVTGNWTVTDGAGSTDAELLLLGGAQIQGTLDATGATHAPDIDLDQESFVNIVNAPASFLSVTGASAVVGASCLGMTAQNGATLGPGTFNCAGAVTTHFGVTTVDSDLNAFSLTSTDSFFFDCTTVLAHPEGGNNLAAVNTIFEQGTLSCALATLQGCQFSGGFQLTAATVTTDAQSWESYLGQGGLPNGAVVTIVGQSASAYAPDFTSTNTITPGTGGVPIAALNLTATQTGLVQVVGVFFAQFTAADAAAYTLLMYTGTSTGTAAPGGKGALLASDVNPIVVPGSSPVVVAGYTQIPATAGITEKAYPVGALATAPVGTAVSLVLVAAGGVPANPWTVGLNLSAFERPLN
jgi:hypothetical protein